MALFPPVSGGQRISSPMDQPTILAITEDEIDLEALVDQVTLTTTGAVAVFVCTVRGL